MEAEPVEILDSLGRVTAEDVIAPLNLPSFDNSAMDGYAVRVADCNRFEALTVTGYIPAGGAATTKVTPGNAIRIMTGAPIPPGCDAIVPLEDVEDAEEAGNKVWIQAAPLSRPAYPLGGRRRETGRDGSAAGTLIRVPAISMLASLGRTHVQVYRKPVVAILATGDELVEPGQLSLKASCSTATPWHWPQPCCEAGAVPSILGIARDDRGDLLEKITAGLQADALITAAGVSVGDCDFVRETLSELGVTQLFGKSEHETRKTMAFGTKDGKPVFSLPGNPVSAMITFEKIVRPALLKMTGTPTSYQAAGEGNSPR